MVWRRKKFYILKDVIYEIKEWILTEKNGLSYLIINIIIFS